MVEFLAIGAHAVSRSRVAAGDRALVVGAGPIGIGTAIFARAAGAEVTVMDISEKRLAYLVSHLGFSKAIPAGAGAAAEIARTTSGDLFDAVFDATGNARAMEASFAHVGHGGILVFVGVLQTDITFSDAEFHKREMTLLASRNAVKADFETVIAAIAKGIVPMDALNTHRVALDELPEAMPDWLASGQLPVKAVLSV
jgi:2-desacetyl-2-hydroxyethyl bacteriochlorophyllide A dehydrogenase